MALIEAMIVFFFTITQKVQVTKARIDKKLRKHSTE
jgi:hypothetical protein